MSELIRPHYRDIGLVNWRGLWTLTSREVRFFLKIYLQTIVAPVAFSVVFYMIFGVAMGGNERIVTIPPYEQTVPFMTFIIPGLIMMVIIQNAFMNASSSLMMSKIQGNLVDVLMPPLSPLELTLGYTLGGIVRGVVVGAATFGVLMLVGDVTISSPAYIAYFAVACSSLMALLGLAGGIWAQKFDHLATLQNFILMPSTFLSGVFFTSDQLVGNWRLLAHLNPFFYMIDGFRYGFIGMADSVLVIGVVVVAIVNLLAFILAYEMLSSGYHLKT